MTAGRHTIAALAERLTRLSDGYRDDVAVVVEEARQAQVDPAALRRLVAWMRLDAVQRAEREALDEGMAPEKVMDPSLTQPAPSPGENFKRGFVLTIYSPKYFGGAVEFGGSSLHLANAIKDVYGEYEAGRAANPGKLPVIACTGSQAMKDKFGTNYRPTFALAKWVDRPAELPSVSPVDAADIWQGNATPAVPARTLAQHVPPPAPKPTANPLAEALF